MFLTVELLESLQPPQVIDFYIGEDNFQITKQDKGFGLFQVSVCGQALEPVLVLRVKCPVDFINNFNSFKYLKEDSEKKDNRLH